LEGTSAGEDAPERLDELIEFCRLRDCGMNSFRPALTRLRSAFEGVTPDEILPATPPVVQPAVLVLAAVPAVMLRVLVLDEER
jgi:hypothetical protein